MERAMPIGLKDVQAVYSGPEGDLWELVMGQQIHVGGFRSSMALAEKAGIRPGMSGVDLCCCNGAGMRFLVRFRDMAKMHGVDATEAVVDAGVPAAWPRGFATGSRSPWPTCATVAFLRPPSISSGVKTPGATWSISRGCWRRRCGW